jgi:myosin I
MCVPLLCNANPDYLLWRVSGSRIEYAKKKDKKQLIKFTKDETILKNDVYKSHVVSVQSGEPPGSLSRPPAKRKAGQVRPITQGKLLRKGGPSTDVGSYV